MDNKKDILKDNISNLDPSDLFYEVAIYYYSQKNFPLAKQNIDISIELYTSSTKIPYWKRLFFLSNIMFASGQLIESLKAFSELLHIEKIDDQVVFAFGSQLVEQSDEKGKLFLLRALEQRASLTPDNWLTHYGLGLVQKELFKVQDSLTSFRKAYELQIHRKELSEAFAREYTELLLTQFKIDEAKEILQAMQRTKTAESSFDLSTKVFEIAIKYKELVNPTSEELENMIAHILEISKNDSAQKEYESLLLKIHANCFITLHQYDNALSLIDNFGAKKSPMDKFLKAQALIEGGQNIKEGMRLLESIANWIPNQLSDSKQEWLRIRKDDDRWKFFLAYIYVLKLNPSAEEISFVKQWKAKSYDDNILLKEPVGLHLRAAFESKQSDPSTQGFASYDIGKWHYDRANYKKAIHFFEEAEGYVPITDPYFTRYRMQALYFTSNQSAPPYWDETKIDTALELLDDPRTITIKERKDYWYLDLEGFLLESKGFINAAARQQMYWAAAKRGELAFSLNQNYYSWSCLSRFYRVLGFYYQSHLCASEALKLSPSDTFALEEFLLANLELGYFEKAEETIATLCKNPEHANYDSWLAFSRYQQGDYTSAIELFERYLKTQPDDLWANSLLLIVYWKNNDMQRIKLADEILKYQYDYRFKNELFAFGWAHFILGKYEEAYQYFTDVYLQNGNHFNGLSDLLLAELVLGYKEKATNTFSRILEENINIRSILELQNDLDHLASSLNVDINQFQLSNKVAALKENPPDAITEFAQYNLDSEDVNNTDKTLALLACKARMSAMEGDIDKGLTTLFRISNPETNFYLIEDALGYQFKQLNSVKEYWEVYDFLVQNESHISNVLSREKWKEMKGMALGSIIQGNKTETKPLQPKEIVIELAKSVLPDGPSDEWPLLKIMIPAARSKIIDESGWEIPGVLIRENDYYKDNKYIFYINDIPLFSGTTNKNDYGQMIEHLVFFLLKHIYQFVNIDSTIRYIERYTSTDSLKSKLWLEDLNRNPKKLKTLSQVLKHLVKHQILVQQTEIIIETFNFHYEENISYRQIILPIRNKLKSVLPGNRFDLLHFNLDYKTEQIIMENLKFSNRDPFLSLYAVDTQKVIDDIKALMPKGYNDEAILWIKHGDVYFSILELIQQANLKLHIMVRSEALK